MHLRVFLLIFILIFFHSAFAQEKWSLQKCIDYAKDNNIQLKQSALMTEGAGQNYFQSKMNLLPTINGNVQYGLNKGKNIDPTTNLFVTQNINSASFSLNSGIKLFGGFTKINEIQQKYFDFMSSQYSTQQAANNIALSVVNAYLQILFTQEQLALAQEQKKVSAEQEARTQKMTDVGILPQGSLYDIQAQVASDELSLVTAQNQLTLAKLNLQQLLNLDKPVDIEIPDLKMPSSDRLQTLSAGEVYEQALTNQPQIKSAEFKLKSSQKGLAISRGGLYPNLSLFASISTNYSSIVQQVNQESITYDTLTIGYVLPTFSKVISMQPKYSFEKTPFRDQWNNNFGQGVGVTLSVPVFNNWITRNYISQSKLNLLNAQYNLDLEKQTLKKDVETAYTDAVAAKDKYAAALKSETATMSSFRYAEQKYNAGTINSLEYITAKNNSVTAKSNVLQSKYEYIFRLKVLDFYQGKPLTIQ